MAELNGVAKLTRVPLRDIWGDEARNFTPWLASEEALGLLSEVIGRDLELIGTEVAVGPYSADVVARVAGQEDHKVSGENQLGKTDHDHLGKVITYAAGLGAKTLVWVSDRFCDEHRAALDWLNENTGDHLSFFGLEIRAFRIDNSRPAPQFTVISSPNDSTKAIRQQVSSSERKSKEDLLAIAARRHVDVQTIALLKLSDPLRYVTAEASRAFGGSFRCWRKGPNGNWRMVIGLNVSGLRKQTPDGQLDLWLPVPSIADVTGTSVEQVEDALKGLPVLQKENIDWILRVKNEGQAEMVVDVLSSYFRNHPASDSTPEPGADAAGA